MNKKIISSMVVVILVVMGGYFGWTEYKENQLQKIVDNLTNQPEVASKVLPEELAAYSYVYGNTESDTVIIDLQGGPVLEFATQSLIYLQNSELFQYLSKREGWVYQGELPSTLTEALFVNIQQYQTLYPEVFDSQEVSFEQVKEYDRQTVEMTQAVIAHFKAQGKKVYVIGTSFGALITQDLLATYGNIADGYLIVVGRLDIPEDFWKGFSRGESFVFRGGVTMESADPEETGMGDYVELTGQNMSKLAAGLGYKRYTDLLSQVRLDNVAYISGETDEQVGRLSDNEKQFLEDKQVRVFIGEGGHGDVANQYTTQALLVLMGMAE